MSETINFEELTPEQQQELLKQADERRKEQVEAQKENRKAYKKLADGFVKDNIAGLIRHQTATAGIVEQLFKDYESILALKKEAYGNKIDGQDSHTSTLPDGSASITIGWNITIGFDGTEAEGVEKIKNYIASLSDDSEKVKKLSKMVNTFLKPNAKTGMLNPSKIIELSKLREEFNNAEFNDGLDIIFNAQQRRRNSMYVSGWQFVQEDGTPPKKIEFRFTV